MYCRDRRCQWILDYDSRACPCPRKHRTRRDGISVSRDAIAGLETRGCSQTTLRSTANPPQLCLSCASRHDGALLRPAVHQPRTCPPRNREPRDPSFVAWQSSSFFIPILLHSSTVSAAGVVSLQGHQTSISLPGSDRLANKVRSLCLRFFPVEKAQSSIEGSRLWMGWLFWTGSSIVRLMGVTKPVSRNLFHP